MAAPAPTRQLRGQAWSAWLDIRIPRADAGGAAVEQLSNGSSRPGSRASCCVIDATRRAKNAAQGVVSTRFAIVVHCGSPAVACRLARMLDETCMSLQVRRGQMRERALPPLH